MKATFRNKKIRRGLCLILALVMLAISFASCKKNQGADTEAAAYIDMAKGFVDEGDYAAALNILQKGYEKTKNADIAVMMAELAANQNGTEETGPEAPTAVQFSLDDYFGRWVDEENSEVTLLVEYLPDSVGFQLNFTSAPPACRIASHAHTIPDTEIEKNTITYSFEDDCWGNSGAIELTFIEGKILCVISEIKNTEENTPMWGFAEGEYSLVPFDEAQNPSTDYEWPTTPVYDMSKASGILAEAGLTEQEFRNICTPVCDYSNTSDRYQIAYGQQYYMENPSEPDVQEAIDEWNSIVSDYNAGGTRHTIYTGPATPDIHSFEYYQTLDNYITTTVYAPKGYSLIKDATALLFDDMAENPNNYLGKPYVFLDFSLDSVGSSRYVDDYYQDTSVTINDLRDDIHAPNVIKYNDYYFYVIFSGTERGYNGRIELNFSLLSLEKIE